MNVNVDFPNRLAHVEAQEDFNVENAIAQLAEAGYDKSRVVEATN